MTVQNDIIFRNATSIIRELYGPNATFRAGQYEAIEATMINRRTLVVQKTGWGKSLIYFACAKMLRDSGRGLTMVVSPLLVLMDNQMDAASKLGLSCEAMNSTTKDRRAEIFEKIENNTLDLLFVTPETVFKDDFQTRLPHMNLGLFVIDEAHCISDWGHDFRLDYGNLYKVLQVFSHNVPILATTATANDRVVEDLKRQLGGDVVVSRGPLSRKSLAIQVLKLRDKAQRYAWILDNISNLPGSGIIYCLTQRDCDYLTKFLTENGISAIQYYSANGESQDERNQRAEELFRTNEIKAIVATIKLGMGYDKPDIGFVIHFQQPGSVVGYYQQIGRAGRAMDRAYAFLMTGSEDEDIINYFINTAFPNEREQTEIIEGLRAANGATEQQMMAKLNMQRKTFRRAVMFLDNEGFITKEDGKYYLTPNKFVFNGAHYDEVVAIRRKEQREMKDFVNTSTCYSKFLVHCLDDDTAGNCGKCANCIGRSLLGDTISAQSTEKAQLYIGSLQGIIEPRKMWAHTEASKTTKIAFQNRPGIALAKYGDTGFGEMVKRDKYSLQHRFSDELVGKSAQVLKQIIAENQIKHLTCVPSLRSQIVADFAKRLAESCKIEYVELLDKAASPPQKTMQNTAHQCANARASFSLKECVKVPDSILLIDDVVDSKWTLTVCGYILGKAGCGCVVPFALADSSQQED